MPWRGVNIAVFVTVQLWECSIWAERINTPGRCSLYFILYHFISSSTCAYRQCSFCLPPFTATQTTSHGMYVWLLCGSVQCPASTHTCAVPYCFLNMVPMLNAEKIDIHWSIAKQSKYCPPQRCSTSPCLQETKGLEPSGRKSRLVASCTKMWNSCAASKNRDYTMQMTCFFKNHEQVTNFVHTHNLVSIAYRYLLW